MGSVTCRLRTSALREEPRCLFNFTQIIIIRNQILTDLGWWWLYISRYFIPVFIPLQFYTTKHIPLKRINFQQNNNHKKKQDFIKVFAASYFVFNSRASVVRGVCHKFQFRLFFNFESYCKANSEHFQYLIYVAP